MKTTIKKRGGLSLRWRMHLMVAMEMVVIVGSAYVLSLIFPNTIFGFWNDYSLLALIVLGLLLSTALTWLLSRMFFNPIKRLNRAMEQVAKGDFSVRLDEKTSAPEVRDLFSGFNLMAKELGNTELLQTDFVSNASHEFKTPLNAIEGYSTLLQNSERLDEQQREYVDKIIFNTRRLSSLTGSILLLSKIENQSIPTNRSRFRLDEQIRQSILAQESAWAVKDIEFDVEMDEAVYYGNEMLLQHVWDNLLSNAIKFSPRSGTVRIALHEQDTCLTVSVDDEGMGIPLDAQAHIFDKFYQADSSHREQGNGLGLALVKRIVALEKGSVEAQNLDHGCRFTVSLPHGNGT